VARPLKFSHGQDPEPVIGQIEIPHRNSLGMRRPTEIVLVNAMPNGNLLQLVSHDKTRWGH
jgi:hypothetical protein